MMAVDKFMYDVLIVISVVVAKAQVAYVVGSTIGYYSNR